MANVNWNQFHEYIMPNVQGCPLAIVNNAIKSSAIEFCERSLLWRLDAEPIDVTAGESRYSFLPPDGSRVIRVTHAVLNGLTLVPVSRKELNDAYIDWKTFEQTSPRMFFMDTPTSITLVGKPIEDSASGLRVQVALKPSRSATNCPDFLYEDWAETIAHGALYRLHSMVGKEWAKVDTVAEHYSRYRDGISRAKSKALNSWLLIPKSAMPVQFGSF